jgi:DNA (cytosine-5)-methyltransferase 1
MSTLHAPDLSAEQLAEIEAALAAVTSNWRPSGAPTGITYTDIFCGYGGSSIGLENAGLQLQLAANHWPLAIETHAANFPGADHLIADVSNYDMRRLPDSDVLWASPICTELSPAGGRRRKYSAQLSLLEPAGHVPTAALDRTRATFWDVVRATEVHRYKVILIENVVEAASWELFDIWCSAMDALGYQHQFISVSSAHVGDETNPHAPQWRDRLYVMFVKVGIPMPDVRPRPLAWCSNCDEINHAVQSWKKPGGRRIGKYRAQYVYRCPNQACRFSIVEPFVRPASDAIDWTDLGERIGDRSKPLADATMRRIRAGIDQFAVPTVISTNHDDGDRRSYPAHAAPMPTRSTKIGDGVACPPFLLDRYQYGNTADHRFVHDASSSPMTTVTANGRSVRTLVTPPFLLDRRDGNGDDGRRVSDPNSTPFGTITAQGHSNRCIVAPPLVVPAGGTWNDDATTVEDPMRTRLTRDTEGLFTPQPWITVLRNHADAASISDPLATVATGSGLGGGHQALTVPPGGDEDALVEGAFIQKHHGSLSYKAIEHMTKSVADPMPGVVARPNLSLVIPYRKGRAKPTGQPLHTVATRESAALLSAAADIDIDECRFRMLKPREHGRAQRFPDDYTVFGNQGEQTMGFGNAVSSNVAQWLGGIVAFLLGDCA